MEIEYALFCTCKLLPKVVLKASALLSLPPTTTRAVMNLWIERKLKTALESMPYPFPDYIDLARKVRDGAVAKAQTDRERDTANAEYSDRLNRIFEWVQEYPDLRSSPARIE